MATALADALHTVNMTAGARTDATVRLVAYGQTVTGFTIRTTNTAGATVSMVAHVILYHAEFVRAHALASSRTQRGNQQPKTTR
jgi:hypothetical protein